MSGDIYEDDNGPAFPSDNKYRQFCTGLTKREWFAGMALQGLLAHHCSSWCSAMFAKDNPSVIIENVHRIADAMLWESEKKTVTAHEINKMFLTGCSCKECESEKGEAGGMNALERLKEIEALVEMTLPDGMIHSKDVEFLLRAVRVYREIALENTISFSWAPSKRPVDKTFEERMKENVQKPNP